MENQKGQDRGGWPRSKTSWVLAGFLAVGAFFLLTEHRAHLLGLLPFLAVLACPLMHLFHHHGHGSHRGHDPALHQPSEGGQGGRK
jgi:DUF2933 family protein